METEDIRMCVSCGAKNKTIAKYCFLCKNNEIKHKCEGWFLTPCDNLTTNGIHRCAMHCLPPPMTHASRGMKCYFSTEGQNRIRDFSPHSMVSL